MVGFHYLSHIQTRRTHAAALSAGNTSVGGRHQSKSRDVEKVRKLLARYHKRGYPAKVVAHAVPIGQECEQVYDGHDDRVYYDIMLIDIHKMRKIPLERAILEPGGHDE